MAIIRPQDRGLVFMKKPPELPYVHQSYPSVRYHRDGRQILVQDADEDAALGDEWASTAFPVQPKPAERPPMSMAQLQRALLSLNDEHEKLKAFTEEKITEILDLRVKLAKAQSHPIPESETQPVAPDSERAESEPLIEPEHNEPEAPKPAAQGRKKK